MNFGGTIHVNKTRFVTALVVTVLLVYLVSKSNNQGPADVSQQVSLRTLLETAVFAAENGGREVVALKNDPRVSIKGKTKEGLDDRVTPADFKSHCAMVSTLKQKFPNLYVISEEHKDCKRVDVDFEEFRQVKGVDDGFAEQNDVLVWIDPLDATQEYTEQLYQYVTIMVCVAVKGKPVIGVIHNPFTLDTTWGWVDYGTSKDLKDVKVRPESNNVKIITSRTHAGDVKERLKKVYKDDLEIVIAGGAGFKALRVATGAVDAYVHMTAIKKWDICAGNAILNALGGSMTTLKNETVDYADAVSVVDGGIIATLRGHNKYVEKLFNVRS